MPLNLKILERFGTLLDNLDVHNHDGFKFGFWVFNMRELSLDFILILLVKKPANTQESV